MGPGRPARPTHTTLISQNTERKLRPKKTQSPGGRPLAGVLPSCLDCQVYIPGFKSSSTTAGSVPLPASLSPWTKAEISTAPHSPHTENPGGRGLEAIATPGRLHAARQPPAKRSLQSGRAQSPAPHSPCCPVKEDTGAWGPARPWHSEPPMSSGSRGGSSRTKNAGLGDSRRRQAGSWGAGVVGRTFPPFLANLIPVSHCTPQCTSLAQRPVSLQEVGVEVPSLWQRLKDRGGWGSQAAVRVKT